MASTVRTIWFKNKRWILASLCSSIFAVLIAACGAAPQDRNPTVQEAGVAYDLQLTKTAAGEFVLFAAGEDPQELESPDFGPSVGYPSPLTIAAIDFGMIERGSFIVISSSVGDLREMAATIDDAAAAVKIDADGRVGVMIAFELDSGAHAFVLSDPSGDVIVARAVFELEDPILGG